MDEVILKLISLFTSVVVKYHVTLLQLIILEFIRCTSTKAQFLVRDNSWNLGHLLLDVAEALELNFDRGQQDDEDTWPLMWNLNESSCSQLVPSVSSLVVSLSGVLEFYSKVQSNDSILRLLVSLYSVLCVFSPARAIISSLSTPAIDFQESHVARVTSSRSITFFETVTTILLELLESASSEVNILLTSFYNLLCRPT